jgi:chemosensory pili system protein ChpA (sensor histidine kinase/response regulator)
MSALRDAIDYTVLGWVKPELDQTLRVAREEIEAYLEDPGDRERMRLCAGYLHQVQGTLRMVELSAPAMVAEEMERLALALQQGTPADRDEATATLMRATVLLPDYLERLQSGHRDIPIVLLPLLNELRAARGETGLSESVLFAPELRPILPDDLPTSAPAGPGAADALDAAFAAWQHSQSAADAAGLATAVQAAMGDAGTSEPAKRMLWVVAAIAEAQRDGALPASPALAGAAAGVFTELHGMRGGTTADNAGDTALRQLLFQLAQSDARHPALDRVRDSFGLSSAVASEAELSHARSSLSGRNRALLETVSSAVKEDLLRVKDTLDLHMRTARDGVDDLGPQVEALVRIADTLGMMGLAGARGVVQEQHEALQRMVSGERAADEGALLDVAGALLYVDATLDDQVARLADGAESAGDPMASERAKVLEALVREAIANFADARQAFVAFIETSWSHEELDEVPRLLDEVAGAMRMLELAEPADYLFAIRRYTEVELLGRRRVPNGQQLDTLADALSSLEYYLEAVRDGRGSREAILDVARNSLEGLGYWPVPEEGAMPVFEHLPAPKPIARAPAARAAAMPANATGTLSLAPLDGTTAADAAAAITGTSGGVDTSAATGREVPPEAGGFDHAKGDIDDEIRDIFLEEFEEEINNLDELLPHWRAVPEDAERLRPIRRVFHTLKGSGRLVGARLLGEFSWKTENLLNRVLDGTRPPTPAVIALVDQAFYTLPQLLGALRGDGPVTADLAALQQVADRLAAGEELLPSGVAAPVATAPIAPQPTAPAEAAETVHADPADMQRPADLGAEFVQDDATADAVQSAPVLTALAAATVATADDAPGVPMAVDAVLLEILQAEAVGQLAALDAWRTRADAGADEAVLRAVHTMNGAFAMTEVTTITALTSPAEDYFRRLLASGDRADASALAASEGLADAVRRTLAALEARSATVPVFAALAAEWQRLAASLPEARVPFGVVAPVDFDADDIALRGDAVSGVPMAAFVDADVAGAVPSAQVPGDAVLAGIDDAATAAADAALLEQLRLEAEAAAQREAEETAHREAEAAAQREAEETARREAEAVAQREAAEAAAQREAEETAHREAEAAAQREAEETARREAEAVAQREAAVQREAAEAARREAEAEAAAQREAAEAARHEAEAAAQRDAEAATRGEAALAADEPAMAATGEDPDEALDTTGLDLDLVDLFLEEARDLLDSSDASLATLREAPGERQPVIALQRDLHTIKGGARVAGLMPLGELGHAMESLLEAVSEQRIELGRDSLPLLERGFDRLHRMVVRIGERRAVALPAGLIEAFNTAASGAPLPGMAAMDAADAGSAPASAAPMAATPIRVQPPKPLSPLSAPTVAGGEGDDDVAVRAPQEQVRVRADLLDRLVNYAGEVAIYRSRLEQQLGAFRGAIGEMDQTNARLRDQLRRLEIETEAQIIARYQREQDTGDSNFDPLELDRFSNLQQLSRALAESSADLGSLQGTLADLTRQYETLLLQQSRVSSDLQEGLMRTRMVPFDALVPRLRRVLRQASSETGKQAQLKVEGAQGEIDRNVLERMTAPLEHMLRNAVVHGLEAPADRRRAGKPEEGSIRIALGREGSEIVLAIEDDGRGLDRRAIRSRAEQRGLLRADAVVSDAELDALILEPGFSTAENVSRLAGRGVGMDVVASEVRQLGGALEIGSRNTQGTRFTLRLPQTLAVTRAVFVRIGDTVFAVPIASVRGVGRIERDAFTDDAPHYEYGGEHYAVHDLGRLLGQASAKAEGQLQMPLLLIGSGELRAAVVVDQVVGNREIVVKPVGPQVASIPGIFGATIMGDGSVVVILDVIPLARRYAAMPHGIAASAPELAVVDASAHATPLVMVVDDSVTMRKVTGRVLERQGFEVAMAKDGIDALERLAERVPDLVLLDIEMPRMDGYELATAMKADPRLRDVPIIMITSRTGEKHRQRALEIGVERYLGKPYQEPELLRNVLEILGIERETEPSDG